MRGGECNGSATSVYHIPRPTQCVPITSPGAAYYIEVFSSIAVQLKLRARPAAAGKNAGAHNTPDVPQMYFSNQLTLWLSSAHFSWTLFLPFPVIYCFYTGQLYEWVLERLDVKRVLQTDADTLCALMCFGQGTLVVRAACNMQYVKRGGKLN